MSIAERECPTTIKGEVLKKVKEGKSRGKTIIKIIEE